MSARLLFSASVAALASAQIPKPPCSQYDPTKKLESPCNIVISNSSLGYVIRAYGVGTPQSWSTAEVTGTTLAEVDQEGFGLNFAYISGANVAKTKIPMTAPVLTRQKDTDTWQVSFFTPASLYPSVASVPVPTDANVTITPFPLSTFAVVEFPGEAVQADFEIAAALLRDALTKDGVVTINDEWAEAWASYDAPFDFFNRHNEVWLHVQV